MKKIVKILIACVLVLALGAFAWIKKAWILNQFAKVKALVKKNRGKGASDGTRGVRNNNPLNIRYNAANDWDGQTGQDEAGFCMFSEMKYGIRAAYKVMESYHKRGIKNLDKIVREWAPEHENPTVSYINYVAKETGLPRTAEIRPGADRLKMIKAMAKFESEYEISTALLQESYRLAIK